MYPSTIISFLQIKSSLQSSSPSTQSLNPSTQSLNPSTQAIKPSTQAIQPANESSSALTSVREMNEVFSTAHIEETKSKKTQISDSVQTSVLRTSSIIIKNTIPNPTYQRSTLLLPEASEILPASSSAETSTIEVSSENSFTTSAITTKTRIISTEKSQRLDPSTTSSQTKQITSTKNFEIKPTKSGSLPAMTSVVQRYCSVETLDLFIEIKDEIEKVSNE